MNLLPPPLAPLKLIKEKGSCLVFLFPFLKRESYIEVFIYVCV